MSTTVNTIPMTVDEKIQNLPDLRKAVGLGSEYFLEEYLGLPNDPDWNKANLTWSLIERGTKKIKNSESDGDHLRAIFVEYERETNRYEVYEDIPLHRMFDEYGRESHMRRLLWSVTSYRHKILQAHMSRLIQELEEESGDGV